MPVFFAGQLWITPTTVSTVDDSAMANQNLSVANVACFIGESTGGEPLTALPFGSPSDAEATLLSGELLTAVKKAFAPSDELGAPATVIAMRVNPALQSTLSLLDDEGDAAIGLTSSDWGAWTKQIKVKLQPGSVQGYQLTTQYSQSFYTADNVYRNAFSIQYTGGLASAAMSITGETLTLDAPSGTVVATIDLTQFSTVSQVVDAINTASGFTAAILDGNDDVVALNGLDYVTNQDVMTAVYTATANLQAVIDWMNGQAEGYVNATRAANAGSAPAMIPFTYLAGGSDGVTTNENWSDAFTALQTVDIQWFTPIDSDPAVAAMADAHAQFMSTTGRMERRAICGTALGTTDEAAIAAAKNINSDRTSLVHLGYWDFDANGDLTLYSPYLTAAMIAGAFSGSSPGTPLSNKTLAVSGWERDLQNPTDTDPLIQGGVLCVENTTSGYKVVQSISTWLVNANYDKVEQSTGAALDFTVRNVREALDVMRGQTATPQNMAQCVTLADSALRALAVPAPNGPGVLAGDANSPAYKNIQAVLAGDVMGVQFQCSPVIPINYITVTVYAVPYSGSASAASSATPSSSS